MRTATHTIPPARSLFRIHLKLTLRRALLVWYVRLTLPRTPGQKHVRLNGRVASLSTITLPIQRIGRGSSQELEFRTKPENNCAQERGKSRKRKHRQDSISNNRQQEEGHYIKQ